MSYARRFRYRVENWYTESRYEGLPLSSIKVHAISIKIDHHVSVGNRVLCALGSLARFLALLLAHIHGRRMLGAAEKLFMEGLDDTIKSVQGPWKLPDAFRTRTREMLAYTDEGGKFPRDPLEGLDKDLTAQEALKV